MNVLANRLANRLDGKFAGILLLLCGAIAAYGGFLHGKFRHYGVTILSAFLALAVWLSGEVCRIPSGSLNSGNLPNVKLFPVGGLHECL